MAKGKKRKTVKGQGEVTTTFKLHTIPSKQEKPLDKCSFVMSGKVVEVGANTVSPIDIATLDLLTSQPIKDVFTTLYNKYAPGKARWTIKNGYGLSLGLCDTVNSYKAMIAHHKDNGANTLIVNGNKHFAFDAATALAGDFKLTIAKGKGSWGMLTVNEGNVKPVVNFIVKLLGMKKAK